MFNILIDDLPEDFRGVKLKTDFRQGLKFFRIFNSDFDENMKARLMVTALFEKPPWNVVEDPQEIMELIGWYISGGKESDDEDSEEPERVFDWNIDHALLYAAFRQVYSIDLRKEKLHWWEFLNLFSGLPDSTKLSRVMEIRGKEIPEKADAKYKAQLKKMKRAFAIDKQGQIEREAQALADGLKGWN